MPRIALVICVALLVAIGLLVLPFLILALLLKILPPWKDAETSPEPSEAQLT